VAIIGHNDRVRRVDATCRTFYALLWSTNHFRTTSSAVQI